MKPMLPALLSILILAWLIAVCTMLPRKDVPLSLLAFLFLQFCFAVLSTLAFPKMGGSSTAYAQLYAATSVPMLIAAIAVAIHHSSPHPGWLTALLFIGGLVQSVAVYACVEHYTFAGYGGIRLGEFTRIPDVTSVLLVQAAVFSTCGFVLLMAQAATEAPVARAVQLYLGGFWLSLGAFIFSYSLGVAQARPKWIMHADWAPSVLAAFFFGALAWNLTIHQIELSRQPQRDARVAEQIETETEAATAEAFQFSEKETTCQR